MVAAPLKGVRPERARRLCLEALLFHLAGHDVTQVTLESRSSRDNHRDLQLVEGLRGRRVIPRSQSVGIGLPNQEPMLWIPDIVAGAVRAAVAGETARWRDGLGRLDEVLIDPT